VRLVLWLEKCAGCAFIFHERTRFLANEATVVAGSRRSLIKATPLLAPLHAPLVLRREITRPMTDSPGGFYFLPRPAESLAVHEYVMSTKAHASRCESSPKIHID